MSRRFYIQQKSALASTAALLVAALTLHAADAPQPADPRPALARLSRETEALYREVRGGLLRVQMPPGGTADPRESPLTKYKELDPKVREALARGNAAPQSGQSAS